MVISLYETSCAIVPLYETSLGGYITSLVARWCASQPSLYHHHLFPQTDFFQFQYESTVFILHFQVLFNTALQEYKDKTGCSLVDHPFAKQFQESDSVESITTILEEQAQVFRTFRDHGKLVNSLKRLVNVFCSPLFTTVLDKVIGLVVRHKRHTWCTLLLIVISQPFSPAKAIFTGICVLLAVCLSSSDPICISP